MDTLHTVDEDVCMERGALTGIKALKSWDRSGTEPQDDGDERPSRKTGTRLGRPAVKILKDWMEQHRDHPYPTEEEKEELRIRTGLKLNQISNWLANTRRRTKIRTPRGVSPSSRSPTFPAGPTGPMGTAPEAIDIPFDKSSIRHNGKTWDVMNPLERWQHSPPENEPAPVSAIVHAVAASRSSPNESSSSSNSHGHGYHRALDSSAGSSSFSIHRPPSITSLETGQSDSLLSSGSLSNLSSKSHGSKNSFSSFGSGVRKDRRRRRRTAANPGKLQALESRPFQCTFCTDTFRTKYDWSRHEKSLHLSLEKWICAPLGPVITVSSSGQKQCVYCGELNPTNDHLETHNHNCCEEKGLAARTFYRKDHLRQHLRLVHGCKMIDSMDSWKSEATYLRCRCGFCGQEFTQWQERIDHLATHFKAGAKMADWKGCRGLDPAVAAQVTNAMPPYLIANEAKSPFPFSASNTASMTHHSQYITAGTDLEAAIHPGVQWPLEPDPSFVAPTTSAALEPVPSRVNGVCTDMFPVSMAPLSSDPLDVSALGGGSPYNQAASTCWEILTLRLGRYVKEQLQLGIKPTDEMLQRQARWILYEDDDMWNQTAADNPEWLDLFKKAHGLGERIQPAEADRLCGYMIEDLGANLGDLELGFDHFFNNPGWDGVTSNDVATSLPATTLMETSMPMFSMDNDFATTTPTTLAMDGTATSLPPTTWEELLATTMAPMTHMG
jgi:Homeobox KN domain/Tc5 transposase DNA-binding domain